MVPNPTQAVAAAVVIAAFNEWPHTERCLQSVEADATRPAEIVVVDNGSTDGTAGFLDGHATVRTIRNPENRGCAAAWNQGLRATRSPWIVFLNNDVVVSPGWLPSLVESAEAAGLGIVSPAMREGALDYDLPSFSEQFVSLMAGRLRRGAVNGACFLVRRAVFDVVGVFDEAFRFGQYEDVDFFRRARMAGFQLGTTGSAFIHHVGGVTQAAIRRSGAAPPYEEWNRRYFRRKWGLTWSRRFFLRRKEKALSAAHYVWEKIRFGHSLSERRRIFGRHAADRP